LGDSSAEGFGSRNGSPRGMQRQRKIAEGELRNNFYRDNSPLKKRIGEIESLLAVLEAEFRALETYFATPESYGDSTEITAKTKKHHELKKVISELTDEWAHLSIESEKKIREYDQAKKDLEAEFTRSKLAG
jgi:hypothetical protein